MKTPAKITSAALLAAALASLASAQIIPDPTGVNTFATPSFAGNAARYSAALGSLYFDSDSNQPSAQVNSWTQGFADVSTLFSAGGGTAKIIFLGESAGGLNDFGYVKQGANIASSASYIPLASEIDNNNGFIASGWETYVNYGAGEKLDFWLNNPGTSVLGGTYFSFGLNGAANAFAGGGATANVKYSTINVQTEYFNGLADVIANVPTLVVAFEDTRLGQSDGDFTDFIFAFQFLPTQTRELPPVPEPSTYALIGSVALLGLIVQRRFRTIRSA